MDTVKVKEEKKKKNCTFHSTFFDLRQKKNLLLISINLNERKIKKEQSFISRKIGSHEIQRVCLKIDSHYSLSNLASFPKIFSCASILKFDEMSKCKKEEKKMILLQQILLLT